MTFKVVHKYAFEQSIKESDFPSGEKTLTEIVSDLGYIRDFSAIVFVDDNGKAAEEISPDYWDYITPKAGIYLVVQNPAGSTFKKIAFIALSIAAVASGQPWLAAKFMTMGMSAAVAGAVAGAVIGAGLSMLSAAMVSYDAPDNNMVNGPASSPTLNITGSRNQVRAGAPVPYHIGTNRFIPPLAAQPVQETNGKTVYFNQVFMVGYAPCIISDLKIGDTPLADFSDVQVQINDGWSQNDQITTIEGDVTIQSGLSIALPSGSPQQITGGILCQKASIIFAFNGGLVSINTNGSYGKHSVAMKIDYRLVGDTTWINHSNPTFTDSTIEQTYRTVDIPVMTKGQYEFRIERTSAESGSSRVRGQITLVTVKTTQLTDSDNQALTVFPDGYAYIGLRIKATGQLNGIISQLSCMVQSVPEVYNGSAFVRTPGQSGNPSWEYLTLMRSAAAKKTLDSSNADLDQFIAWGDRCNTLVSGKPRHRINHVVDYSGRQENITKKIASIGRAAPAQIDGIQTIIMDIPGKPAIQKFTNSNSYGFSASKVFAKKPDAFRCNFVNPAKNWTVDYVNIKRVDTKAAASSDIIEDLSCIGITDIDELYRYAKFAFAQIELRPETYSLKVGVESLFTTKGDIVVISHDRIQGDVTSSRVSSVSGNDVILINPIDTVVGTNYFASFRHSQSAQTNDVYAVTIIGNVVTLPVTAAAAFALAGDIILIGTAAESVDRKYIIKAVANNSDFNATLTLVDYADPAIYASEDGDIVDYVPGAYKPAINQYSAPLAPTILQIITDERALLVNLNGTFSPRISVELQINDVANRTAPATIILSYRPSGSDGYYKNETYPADQSLIYANDVMEGTAYDIRVRYVTANNEASGFATQGSIIVTGKTTPPADVVNFGLENNEGNVSLTWDSNTDVDIAGYVIKFTSATSGETWGGSVNLSGVLGKSSTQMLTPARTGTYLIKAVDTGGRQSVGYASKINLIESLSGFNVVEIIDEDPAFSGAKTNCHVAGGGLRLTDSTSLTTGTYDFDNEVDLGGVYDSRLSVDMVAVGVNTNDTMSAWITLNSVTVLSSTDPADWGVVVEVRTSQQAINANVWSEWKELRLAASRARSFQFRAILTSDLSGTTPLIQKLSITIDMPDRTESGDNITSAIGGTIITFDNGAFNVVPAVVVTGDNLNTGDYYRKTSQTASTARIEFFNSSNASISRTFDYVASGYGFKQ